MTHTPRPWRMTHTGFFGVGILPSTGDMRTEGDPIITCWSACIGSEEAEANARLIAAAPELLEALELVLDTYGFDSSTDSSIWQTVTSAIARAKGSAS